MIEWQPIETAPKDGSRLLMWDGVAWVAQWFSTNEGRTSGWDADSHFLSQPTHWCAIQPPET